MKKALALIAFVLLSTTAYADIASVTLPSSVEIKQGFLVKWSDSSGGMLNLSTVTIARTQPWDKLGWANILWDGNTIDLGAAYDGTGLHTGAILLGREFGTIGKYLPVQFPLADRLSLTLYPIGIYSEDPMNNLRPKMASGAGIIKLSVNW